MHSLSIKTSKDALDAGESRVYAVRICCGRLLELSVARFGGVTGRAAVGGTARNGEGVFGVGQAAAGSVDGRVCDKTFTDEELMAEIGVKGTPEGKEDMRAKAYEYMRVKGAQRYSR